jgi:hypothetical protein
MISYESFFSGIRGVLRVEAHDDIPQLDNTLVFSYGDNLPSVLVTVTDSVMDSFLESPPAERAEIMQHVLRRF